MTKDWVIVDATDQVLGRLGAKVAKLLRGKYKPNFTPHVDCGDNVIIINADKVKLTGNKWNDKVYLSYTGYPGCQREITPARLQAKPNGDDKLLSIVFVLAAGIYIHIAQQFCAQTTQYLVCSVNNDPFFSLCSFESLL